MSRVLVFGAGYLGRRLSRDLPNAVSSAADIADAPAVKTALDLLIGVALRLDFLDLAGGDEGAYARRATFDHFDVSLILRHAGGKPQRGEDTKSGKSEFFHLFFLTIQWLQLNFSLAARHRGGAGTADIHQSQRAHKIDKSIYFFLRARDFENKGFNR